MELDFRNFPTSGLPYNNTNSAMSAIIKLFEKNPFLPELKNVDENDTLLNITLSNVPCISKQNLRVSLVEDDVYKKYVRLMDSVYNDSSAENLECFRSDSIFMDRYFKAIQRICPKKTIVRLYGPFSLLRILTNIDCAQGLNDRTIRKFIVQLYVLKSLWFISKINELSPKTKLILVFEEPLLKTFSSLKRLNENIENNLLVELYAKIFDKLHKNGALVGVECFEKCDWQIPIDAKVDLISFDAYHNPHNLNIIVPKVQDFLLRGGAINWGIVPLDSPDTLIKMNTETVYERFINTVESLVSKGLDSDLVYNNSLLSVVGDIDKLPLIFSEKAMLLASKAASRIAGK